MTATRTLRPTARCQVFAVSMSCTAATAMAVPMNQVRSDHVSSRLMANSGRIRSVGVQDHCTSTDHSDRCDFGRDNHLLHPLCLTKTSSANSSRHNSVCARHCGHFRLTGSLTASRSLLAFCWRWAAFHWPIQDTMSSRMR